jgi:hypothetical protein
MGLGVRLIKLAALYLLAGLILGLAMGITGNFVLVSVHSHVLLLGWATMGVAGVIYRFMPECAAGTLATLHFWGHNAGLPLMMASLATEALGVAAARVVVGQASALVAASLALFVVNVVKNGKAGGPLSAPFVAPGTLPAAPESAKGR